MALSVSVSEPVLETRLGCRARRKLAYGRNFTRAAGKAQDDETALVERHFAELARPASEPLET